MRILIVGYYGYENAGDEAMLSIVINKIKREFPFATITIWSGNPEQTKERTGCETYLHPFAGGKKWWRHVFKADVLIFGGGNFLQDYGKDSFYPWQNLKWYLKTVSLARFLGKKVLMLGIGIGPIDTVCGKAIALATVALTNWIGIRDPETFRFLRPIRYMKRNIHLTEDLVFLFQGSNKEPVMSTRPQIGICLREFKPKSTFSLDTFLKSLVKVIRTITEIKPCDIHLIPFQGGEDGDVIICKQFVMQYGVEGNILLHEKETGVESVYKLIQQMDIVIAMRLHAVVFSVLAQKPVIALSYHPKVSSFAKRWDIPCYDIWSFSDERPDFTNKILALMDREVHYDITKAIENARKNLQGLNILVKRVRGNDG